METRLKKLEVNINGCNVYLESGSKEAEEFTEKLILNAVSDYVIEQNIKKEAINTLNKKAN